LGLKAYDRLHDIRSELFRSILSFEVSGSISAIRYRGGSLLDMTSAWLWYQFEFEYDIELGSVPEQGYADVREHDVDELIQPSQLPDFDKMYVNFLLAQSSDLPYNKELPLEDNYPNVILPDMANWIDFTESPYNGAFGKGYGKPFSVYGNLGSRFQFYEDR
jgi:hypothetical protein